MMKSHRVIFLATFVALGGLIALNSRTHRIAPAYLYPTSLGEADTLDINNLTKLYDGKTYSESHRNVTERVKKIVLGNQPKAIGAKEIDHVYPVCAGGSNSEKNLWVQPAVVMWNGRYYGFHEKDKLEAWVCSQIKKHLLDPPIAFRKITGDWVAYYDEVFRSGNLGGLGTEDSDDEEFLN